MSRFDSQAGLSGRAAMRKSVLVIAAAAALGAMTPQIASAAPAGAVNAGTDLSAARRQHHIRRPAAERPLPTARSFGGTMNYGPYQGASGSGSFGYGVGDNSRGQTW